MNELRVYIIGLIILSSAAAAQDVLSIYNWSNYIGPTAIARFEKICKCSVKYETFGDNDELLARLEGGAKGYDILVPTSNAVETLIKKRSLKPIDKTQLPNIANIKAEFLNRSFDPGNAYSVPYGYTLTVIGYQREKLSELGIPTDTLAAIFDPRYLAKIRGRVTVLDSPNELFAAALKYKGYSANDTDPQHWDEAKQVILTAKPFWQAFNNTTYGQALVNGNIWLALGYNNDFFQAAQRANNKKRKWTIAYTVPKQGAVFALDSMVIHKDSPRPDLANQFMNFMMDGQNLAELSNTTGSGSPNAASMKFLQPDVANNKGIFPDRQTMQKLEMLQDLTTEQRHKRSRLWADIKMKTGN
jgi:spermidine/putrescine transport system substrate-binding protein